MIYTELNVYKDTYELLKKVTEISSQFSKNYKFTLWNELRSAVIEVVKLTYRFNSTFDLVSKIDFVKKSREKIEEIRLYLRLCRDLNLMWEVEFWKCLFLNETVSKQLTWLQKNFELRFKNFNSKNSPGT